MPQPILNARGLKYGPDGVAVVIQGKLAGDDIIEAGIVAQPKVRPQTATAEAA